MEQKTRFDDITWPTLKTGIMSEGGDVLDKPLPEFYRCDGIHTSLPYENSYKMGSLVQIQSKEAQATHAATCHLQGTRPRHLAATQESNRTSCRLKAPQSG